jgi:hypothetical protein
VAGGRFLTQDFEWNIPDKGEVSDRIGGWGGKFLAKINSCQVIF